MSITGLIEALGFGAARDARLLVERLPKRQGLTVATEDERIAKALSRAQHRRALLDAQGSADAAVALELPEGEAALVAIERLAAATRSGGLVMMALSDEGERTRTAGLFLRAGLVDLAQARDEGLIVTVGRVLRG